MPLIFKEDGKDGKEYNLCSDLDEVPVSIKDDIGKVLRHVVYLTDQPLLTPKELSEGIRFVACESDLTGKREMLPILNETCRVLHKDVATLMEQEMEKLRNENRELKRQVAVHEENGDSASESDAEECKGTEDRAADDKDRRLKRRK